MSEQQPPTFAEQIFSGVKAYLSRNIQPLHDRISALEQRAQRPVYRGVWRDGETYCAGQLSTHGGLAVARQRRHEGSAWRFGFLDVDSQERR